MEYLAFILFDPEMSGNELIFNNGGSLVKMEVEGRYIVSTRINKLASYQFVVRL
jgi:hypothetical protein